ncbi:MAG TPA: SDR family NAD(P)-dependent oxidoreductase [Polyangia bacterium]|jgi:uncharacterized oxidoreductase|nr:SDR family NAD(P)-dependent oxidoreductase [Polyangia bacterium]
MQLDGNTVLITGGASGIGLAMAKRFHAAGSEVIVCGRDENKLRRAREAHPGLVTYACDVGKQSDREELVRWATREHPKLNVVVNNAGIQRHIQLAEQESWAETEAEVAINFHAPVQLCRLFIPHLLTRERPVLINVTSGLAFIPSARTPVYAATKAAMHSFTVSLRQQLAATPIQVIEVIPPAVNTDLGGVGLHAMGVALDEYGDAVFAALAGEAVEFGYGFSEKARLASRAEIDEILARFAQRTT